jgi:hypothetical protein
VRNPRPGLAWSTQRLHRRAAYCNYMVSQQWFALRERWVANWTERYGTEPLSLICGAEWALCDDLYHRTYERLGRESRHDLIPLCLAVIALCTGPDRSWRRLGRAQATDLVVLRLRSKHWTGK